MGKEATVIKVAAVHIAQRKAAMADSSANIPQHPGWNAPNASSAVEHATIGASIVIKGEITGNEALFVDGNVEGTINIPGHRVTVGRNSTVKADINAREVVIMGEVRGNIHCDDLLDIRSESHLTGQIVTQRIRIDDGAVLKGSVEIQRTEKAAAARATPAPAEAKKPETPLAAEKTTAAPATGTAVTPTSPSPASCDATATATEPEAVKTENGAKALAAAVARRMASSSFPWK